MRILFFGNFNNPSWDGSIPDEKTISNGFKKLGVDVVEAQREDPVLKCADNIDYILISQWYGYPEHFCQWLKTFYECRVVYWSFDYQFRTKEQWHLDMAKEADIFLSPEIAHKEFYNNLGANFHWVSQELAQPFMTKKTGVEEYDVVFTGSYVDYGKFRIDLLKAVDERFNLHVFSCTPDQWRSVGLKNVHPAVLDADYPALIAKSKINLSVDLNQVPGLWSVRNSRVMACGGLVLFKYTELSEVVFRDNVVYFNTIEECLKHIRYLLDHDDLRQRISDSGYCYALGNFTVLDKLGMVMTIIRNTIKGD